MLEPRNLRLSGKLPVLLGVILAAFAVFATISTISYLATWKEDQSLLYAPDYFDECMQLENGGGAFGYPLGRFFFGTCFGFGAFLLYAVLFIVAWRLVRGRDVNWMVAAFLGVAGSLFLGCILSWVGMNSGSLDWDTVFGGGIGGGCCYFLSSALVLALGPIMAPVLLFLFFCLLVYMLFDISSFSGKEEKKQQNPVQREETPVIDDENQAAALGDLALLEEIQDMPVTRAPVTEVPAVDNQDDIPDVKVVVEGPVDELSTEIEEDLPEIDIRGELDRYEMPSLDLLQDYADKHYMIPKEEIDRNISRIKTTLASFKIPVDGMTASVGYTVTLYKISLGEGVRVNSVKNLEDDIAIKIGIRGVRVVMLADAVGIEVPNERPSVVPLKAILNSDAFRNSKGELPIGIGYTITTKAKVLDLADAPHLLVAGATKQGKSVGLNAIIASLLYSKHPAELKMVFIDPKMVEFQKYSKLYKHYLAVLPSEDGGDDVSDAIVKDPKSAEAVLRSLCVEMDNRYKLMSEAGVNKVTDYNEKYRSRHLLPTLGHKYFPYIVIVVDEYADLTKSTFGNDRNTARSIENSINRLAAKGRAAGLHIIIATQRPSVDVITGTIKGNFPTRMAFKTAQRQDSMTILGMPGAERLIGKGDMLLLSGADAERVQCALVDSDEIDALTDFIYKQDGYRRCCSDPYILPDPGDAEGGAEGGMGGLVDMSRLDECFEEAAKLAVVNQQVSTSMIQRKLSLGFARAGRVVDQLEAAGIIGPQQGSKSREVLVPDLASLEPILNAFLHK